MFDRKAFGSRRVRIRIDAIGDDNALVWDARIAEVLRLRGSLVPESTCICRPAFANFKQSAYPRNTIVLSSNRLRFASLS